MNLYDVILADPPWPYSGSSSKMGAAAKFYNLMSKDEIFEYGLKFVVPRLAKNGIVFMWATSPRLDIAIQAFDAWGLHYRGIQFVWVKTKQDGTPIGAQGVRPSIVKPVTELVIAGSRVKTGRPMKIASESVEQVVLAPKREHSRKPDQVHQRIDILYPDAKKLELFARREYPGWDAEGDQLTRIEIPC
jgi:N6-adenosine-specific RNA methylase IME4